MRHIHSATNGDYTAKVYYDREWEEYVVKFYYQNKPLGADAHYHTDDKEDAIKTGTMQLLKYSRRGH